MAHTSVSFLLQYLAVKGGTSPSCLAAVLQKGLLESGRTYATQQVGAKQPDNVYFHRKHYSRHSDPSEHCTSRTSSTAHQQLAATTAAKQQDCCWFHPTYCTSGRHVWHSVHDLSAMPWQAHCTGSDSSSSTWQHTSLPFTLRQHTEDRQWPLVTHQSSSSSNSSNYWCVQRKRTSAVLQLHNPAQATSFRTGLSGSRSSGCRHLTTSTAGGSSSSSSSGPSAAATWVDKYLPQGVQPYAQLMRLDKPIGSWLLAWPGLWSIALAAQPGQLPDLWLTALFGVGAVMMRGAGCTINDLWDRDIDKQVERTKTRPLAAGTVTQTAALIFLAAQLSLSLGILLQLNLYTQVLGFCSLGLVVTYPLMKRITWWPQAFLGLCMNYGVLMGWSAAAGVCDWPVVLPLYAAGVNWTLVYDTIYAHQDKKDDVTVGVKSTALLFGDRTKQWSTGFAVLQTLGLGLAGQAAGAGAVYHAAVAAAAAHQAWQISSVDLNSGPDCMAKFVSNKWYGAILYAGIVADRLLLAA